MELPTPTARYLREPDRAALAAFRCSTGAWYEDRVERFVARELLDRKAARRPHTDYTALGLELPAHGLVAVGAHEEDLIRDGEADVTSTYLEVAAVAVGLQGATLPDVRPLDDDGRPVSLGRFLMEALISDAAATDRFPAVRATVARENVRSLALCDRIGLTRELPDTDGRFVSRLGVLPRA